MASILYYYNRFRTRLTNKINTYIYSGNKVHCEMCEWHGSKFPKGRCPNCNSLPRTRLIAFAVNHFKLNQQQQVRLLHIAPNRAEMKYMSETFNFNNGGQYDRLDILPKYKINIVQDLTKLQIEDEQYDLIIIWHVLEHIPNDYKAISEMYRVLRPGGKALVSVPIVPFDREITYEDDTIPKEKYKEIHSHPDHCRSCGLDYYKRFETIGFNTEEIKVIALPPQTINKYGLSEKHVAWLFAK